MSGARAAIFRGTVFSGTIFTGAVLAVALGAGGGNAASFDCAKARTLDEQLICGDQDLSSADETLAAAYRAMMAGLEQARLDTAVRDRLRGEQRAWVTRRNERCGLASTPKPTAGDRAEMTICLKDMTVRRRAVLDRLREGLPVSALVEQRSVRERRPKQGYEIEAAYPALPAAVPGAAAFNAAVDGMVRPLIDGFRQSIPTDEVPAPDQPSSLNLDYQVTYASPELLSVQFDSYEFPSGAAHGTPGMSTLHVDLARGRTLAADDVFAPGSGWQAALAEHCRTELQRQAREGDFELYDEEGGIADGIAQSAGDLGAWRLEADRAVIVFVPYQVAAYAVGTLEVPVSYALLRPYLKPGGPLPPQR